MEQQPLLLCVQRQHTGCVVQKSMLVGPEKYAFCSENAQLINTSEFYKVGGESCAVLLANLAYSHTV